jgi:hypothetical protein
MKEMNEIWEGEKEERKREAGRKDRYKETMPVRIHKALWPQPASLSLRATMAPTTLMLLLLCTAAATASLFRIPLDTNSTFSWTLDYPAGTVSVEVHSPAERDHWVAVGFSDYGALGGADLCVLWKDWRGHTHLQVGSLTHRHSRLSPRFSNFRQARTTFVQFPAPKGACK